MLAYVAGRGDGSANRDVPYRRHRQELDKIFQTESIQLNLRDTGRHSHYREPLAIPVLENRRTGEL